MAVMKNVRDTLTPVYASRGTVRPMPSGTRTPNTGSSAFAPDVLTHEENEPDWRQHGDQAKAGIAEASIYVLEEHIAQRRVGHGQGDDARQQQARGHVVVNAEQILPQTDVDVARGGIGANPATRSGVTLSKGSAVSF